MDTGLRAESPELVTEAMEDPNVARAATAMRRQREVMKWLIQHQTLLP